MTPADIITRLKDHERDHANHKAAVHSWLIEAGFHPDLSPCRVVLHVDSIGVWCGDARKSNCRAIELHCTPTRSHASVVSYGGHTTYHTCMNDAPVEALQALAASGKVPKLLLKEKS